MSSGAMNARPQGRDFQVRFSLGALHPVSEACGVFSKDHCAFKELQTVGILKLYFICDIHLRSWK